MADKLVTVELQNLSSGSNADDDERVMYGFGGEDTLEFVGGTVTGSVIRGDDVVLLLSDGSYFRVKNAKGRYLNIVDDAGAHYKQYGGSYTYTPQNVIQNFMAELDTTTLTGAKALDAAVAACSSKFSTIKEAIAQCVADCKNADDYKTFLRQYCGIELTDYDTGAITGWDAANSKSKDGEDIVPETGSQKTFSGTSFTANGLTLTVPTNLNDTQQAIINSLYTWWANEGLNLVAESYGDNYGFTSASSATVKTMNVEFVTSKDNFLALVRYSYESKSGRTAALTLQINMRYYSSIKANDVNGESSNSSAGYLDRTLAHEFTHAVMAANITHFSKLPNFIVEGMAELTHGIDDWRQSEIITLASNSSKLNSNLNVSDTKSSKSSIYAAGYIFLRYLAKQSAVFEKDYFETYDPKNPPVADESTDGVKYSDSKKTKLVISEFIGVVDASNFNSKLVTLDAATDDQFVVLIGNKGGNVLVAGSDGSSMDGGAGADKLYGGNGEDTFSYSLGGGADQFYKFNGSKGDIVQLFGVDSISKSDFKDSGKNIVLTVGTGKSKGTITFNNPTGVITVVDSDGETLATYNEPLPDGITADSKKTKLTVKAPFSGMLELSDYGSTYKEVDASSDTNVVSILGNAQANVLKASSVGSYLYGDAGADKLYGGAGADTFAYIVGTGNDQIYNFDGSKGDVVQLFGVDSVNRSDFKDSSKNIVLTVGSGKTKSTLTFVEPKNMITIIDEDGETLATYNEPLPDGITADSKKTKLTVKAPFEGTLELSDYGSTFKEVDASSDTNVVSILGNNQANVLKASSVGSYLDGDAGADKLYGGAGADTFAYSLGGGADQIYNFEGSKGDVVQLFGVDSVSRSDFKDSSKSIVLTVGSGKNKGSITFNAPTGRITVVDGDGETLATYNEPLPDGVTADSKKTKLTVKAPFEGTLDLGNYASTYKEVNASSATGVVNVVGNAQANVLTASSVGSYLDGGAGGDKLYGGAGADTFAYSDGGGSDQVYNYSYDQNDVISISGTIKSSSVSGKNVALKIGSGSLTLNDVVDKYIAIDVNGTTTVYKFDKNNATLAKAAANAATSINQQLPAEDYWFVDDPITDPIDDPLDQIVETKDISVDTSALVDNDLLNRSTNNPLTTSTTLRHRRKK